MYDEGFTHNYNIDISQNVIDFMKSRNKDKKGLHFDVMDVCEMTYKDETFINLQLIPCFVEFILL